MFFLIIVIVIGVAKWSKIIYYGFVMNEDSKRLIEGSKMHCPRCKKLQPVETFMRMQEIEEFESETNPIYKCSQCKWIFSPGDPTLPFVYAQLLEEMSKLREELSLSRNPEVIKL